MGNKIIIRNTKQQPSMILEALFGYKREVDEIEIYRW